MVGCPVILNVLPATGIETRNAVPVEVWQSVQWQICVRSGSASPSILMAPHEHPPSIFMTLFLLFHRLLVRSQSYPHPTGRSDGRSRAPARAGRSRRGVHRIQPNDLVSAAGPA